jgi:membrane-bound lytic murein transglycosylase D
MPAMVFNGMVIFSQRLAGAGNHGLHTHPKILRFLLPPLPSFFLILAAAALFMGGFTACAPLENSQDAMHAPEPIPMAEEQQDPPRQEARPFLEEPALQALDLTVSPEITTSPEISELTQLDVWETLPLLSLEEEEEPYDFPITMNEQVEYYLDFFQNRHRKTFARWLARSSRYLPMIKEEFARAGLPLDLAYLPMIESGFNTTALSSASAVGTWQFMRATGISYGLTVNKYVDERRDPVKSTKAAAAYLSKLYKDFDSWHLAVAAYNAGEGRIKRAMKQSETDDFWEIAQSQYIHSETKLYVPQLIAAIMIAKDPEKYGFDNIEYEAPLDFETVHVPCGTPLKAVAVACDLPEEEILRLNRQLSKAITPPSAGDYPLRVPTGKKDLVTQNLPKVKKITVTEFKDYRVKRGETLTTISRKHKLSKTTLLKANPLEQERLSLGQHLRIPYQTVAYRLTDEPVHFARAEAVAFGEAMADAKADADDPVPSLRPDPFASKKMKSGTLKKKKSSRTSPKKASASPAKKKKLAASDDKEKTIKTLQPSSKKSFSDKKI